MERFPYITDYINDVFGKEKTQWDYILLRPLLLVFYFFLRFISFPIKFVLRRRSLGFERYLIDSCMAFGTKYLARHDAAELFMRHVQLEPILYRHMLTRCDTPANRTGNKLNGIDGEFGVEDTKCMIRNNMTIGHDLLSYELVDRFDKQVFLDNLQYIRTITPEDHREYSKAVLELNRKHSFQLLGATNLVLLIVTVITIFGDLKTTIKALNSFESDSIMLWCMKHIYAEDTPALIDLDFFMQEVSNRGHYNSSAFFSNPSQYLYYHIVFDEVVYDMLLNRPPAPVPA